jgi:hypothetical protein
MNPPTGANLIPKRPPHLTRPHITLRHNTLQQSGVATTT